MALQGTLDTFALPDVLRLLAATRKTGRLRITGDAGSGSLWVEGGSLSGIEAAHAPQATEPVDALFELLRFTDGSFTFDTEASPDATLVAAEPAQDVEALLEGASALLAEWRQIESVVPSLDAWVSLRPELRSSEVTIPQDHWATLVAIGGGATVRQMGEQLSLAELPVCRAVRDLVDLGVVDVAPEAPPDHAAAKRTGAPRAAIEDAAPTVDQGGQDAAPAALARPDESPLFANQLGPDSVAGAILEEDGASPVPGREPGADPIRAEWDDRGPVGPSDSDAPLPTARPLRARRAKGASLYPQAPSEPEPFVPLDLPGHSPASYDAELDDQALDDPALDVDDLAAAFPGLAGRSTEAGAEPDIEADELVRQLASLSPRAAEAVRIAAEAGTDEERDAALDEAVLGEAQPINRGLLLKFLSSVRS